MLILTRKKNETIHIGDGISITVIRVSGNKVRLGVSAPRDLRVMRIELDASPSSPAEQTKTSLAEADAGIGEDADADADGTSEAVSDDKANQSGLRHKQADTPTTGTWDADGDVESPKAA